MASDTAAREIETIQTFRAKTREELNLDNYSGRLHLVLLSVLCLSILFVSLNNVSQVSALEWLTVPIAFMYGNIVEYFGHKGPMHRPTIKILRKMYQRHAALHHKFYSYHLMYSSTHHDWKTVLFPPVLLLFFLGGFATPVAMLLFIFASRNIAFLFLATAAFYFLNYEWLHLAYHLPPDSWVLRIPGIRFLRKHHLAHHHWKLMNSKNFNITYPICDYLFGTAFKGPIIDRPQPALEAEQS